MLTPPEDSTDLQIDLDNLCDWATLNELDFQPKKCVNLRISRKLCSFDRVYIINRMDHLTCVSSQRDLGVAVTKNLSRNDHIEQISAKAKKMLGFIRETVPETYLVAPLRLFI